MSYMKPSQWRGPFLLALSLFLLGTFAYWLEYKQRPKKEEKEEETRKLFALKDTPVQAIKIANGAKLFEFRCLDAAANLCKPGDNSKWEVAVPSKLKADDSNVNSLLSTLNNIRSSDTIDLKDETPEKRAALLKDYGLDSAAMTAGRRVEVTSGKGTTILYLGQTHPIGENIFAVKGEGAAPAKLDENRVYLVPNYFKTNFEKELTFWRDKKILTISAHEVQSFMLEGSKVKLSGERKDGKWTLTVKKEEFPGDIENVESLLNTVSYLSAKEFVSDDKTDKTAKAALRGAKPILKFALEKQEPAAAPSPGPSGVPAAKTPGGAPVLLTFYLKKAKPERLYATVSNLDPLFEMDMNAKDRLDKDLKDLRLVKLITSMERFTVKKLEFSGAPMGGSTLLLANMDGKWVSTPDKTEMDPEKIQKFLDKLSGNRIKEFLSGRQVPTGEAGGLKVTLGDDKTDVKRQFVFWKNADKLYGRDLLAKKQEAFLIDNALKDELPWNRDFFRKSSVVAPKK